MGSSKLMVASLSCAELGTAQPQLVLLIIFWRGAFCDLSNILLFFLNSDEK